MAELTKYLNVINGELKPANSGQWIESINPATGEVVGLVPDSDESDVNEAVAAARAALPAWRSMPAQQRTFILRQIGQQMAQYGEELAKLETLDNGRLLKENIQRAGIGMSFSWQAAAGQTMEATIGKSANFDPVTYGYTLREPYGVVAVITPWNAPVAMMTQKMSLALAAGNTVVVKPAEVACMAVLRCAEILSKMLPPGVINFVSGLGQKTGVPLVRHRGVNKITMTGSSTTGKAIQRESADNLTTSILELGGKSPMIIFPDADLEGAAVGATLGSIFTGNAGQVCVAGSRILIHRSIMDDMLNRFYAIMDKVVVGDPFDDNSTMGPIVSEAQFKRVTGYIEIGKQESKLLKGGRYGAEVVPSRPNGYWVEPTLFYSESNSIRTCQEEIFGPVATVLPFETEEEAIAIANDCDFGLAAGVWTKDLARAHRCIRNIEAGSVWVNTYRQPRPELPFGGYKDSGYGHDEILEFTREKSTVVATVPAAPLFG